MIYLLCALLGIAALLLVGTMETKDVHGCNAHLLDLGGHTVFPLYPYTRVGGKYCDIDLTRYGCAPEAELATIAVKAGIYYLSGIATVSSGEHVKKCVGTSSEIALMDGDRIELRVNEARTMDLEFRLED
jgi:hypothetical protein